VIGQPEEDLMDVVECHRRAIEAATAVARGIGPDQWHEPTPCSDWDVRAVLNHITGENLWCEPLLAGGTIAEVGDRFDGDLLGDDPIAAWERSASIATAAVGAQGAMDVIAHLSFADLPGRDYASQLFADMLVHTWDLARAVGGDETLPPHLVAECGGWFDTWELMYRGAGVIGPALRHDDSDPQVRLLGRFGRDASPDSTLAVIRRFNEAFGRHDVDAVMALMTDDVVFEGTNPPHGTRCEGQAAVRAVWEGLFGGTPSAKFVTEEGVIAGDRATYRWVYHFDGGSVRGVDVFRVRDGKVAEKLSYVKG
jgi:uncharacterized protein (TIGR03086 family)